MEITVQILFQPGTHEMTLEKATIAGGSPICNTILTFSFIGLLQGLLTNVYTVV